MQMILDELTSQELAFLLRLLNAAKSYSFANFSGFFRRQENIISGQDATSIDRDGDALRKRYEKNRVKPAMRTPNSYFAKSLHERKINHVVSDWSRARIPAVSAVSEARKSSRSFVHAPSIIGVPAHRPPVLINEPADLVNWLVLRGFANGQMARFVLCELCKKFGLRERANKQARFCSPECQIEFNIKRKKDGEFAAVASA
jgi:hypothetical protein